MEKGLDSWIEEMEEKIVAMRRYLGISDKEEQIVKLETSMGENSFWENQEMAKRTLSELKELKICTEPFAKLSRRFSDLIALYPEVEESGDEELLMECEREATSIERLFSELENQKMLSHEMDSADCYLSINAGAGGTESCDWVEMLVRMYQRWFSKRGWQVEEVDVLPGTVAGIKNITLKIEGDFAYGYTKTERGVHRLVRISPFDSNARRHTSFASVDVIPVISEEIDVEIRPEDLRVDTFRSSGAGGQHVNTTDSAVRMTHIPSGITVSCQKERSQIQNRETCLHMLKGRLYEEEERRREKEIQALGGGTMENSWGSQIRSYVFQPYQMVKDHRTGVEIGNVDEVMNGSLDPFVYAALRYRGEKR